MSEPSQIENLLLSEELALYEPAPEVLQKMGEIILYAVVAPYSSGKDSIVNWLVSHWPDKFAPVIGDATREPRQGETDGITYHFRSKADAAEDLHKGRLVQVAPGFGSNFYATRPEQYPIGKIAIKPIQAGEMANFQKLGLKELKWFQIVPHSFEAWEHWQADRNFSPKDQADRDKEAVKSYSLALTNPHTLFVLNDEVEKAAERILRVAEGRQLPDATLAKQIAVRNLEQLKRRLDK